MPRTALPAPTKVTRTGVTPATPTAMDAVNGNTLINTGETYFDVTNSDGAASHTLTINITQLVDGSTPAAKTYTLAANAVKRFANFPVAIYGGSMQLNADSAMLEIASYVNSD